MTIVCIVLLPCLLHSTPSPQFRGLDRKQAAHSSHFTERVSHQRIARLPPELLSQECYYGLEPVAGGDLVTASGGGCVRLLALHAPTPSTSFPADVNLQVLLHYGSIASRLESHHHWGGEQDVSRRKREEQQQKSDQHRQLPSSQGYPPGSFLTFCCIPLLVCLQRRSCLPRDGVEDG